MKQPIVVESPDHVVIVYNVLGERSFELFEGSFDEACVHAERETFPCAYLHNRVNPGEPMYRVFDPENWAKNPDLSRVTV